MRNKDQKLFTRMMILIADSLLVFQYVLGYKRSHCSGFSSQKVHVTTSTTFSIMLGVDAFISGMALGEREEGSTTHGCSLPLSIEKGGLGHGANATESRVPRQS
jgi:hypothetical protein